MKAEIKACPTHLQKPYLKTSKDYICHQQKLIINKEENNKKEWPENKQTNKETNPLVC